MGSQRTLSLGLGAPPKRVAEPQQRLQQGSSRPIAVFLKRDSDCSVENSPGRSEDTDWLQGGRRRVTARRQAGSNPAGRDAFVGKGGQGHFLGATKLSRSTEKWAEVRAAF